MGRDGKNGYLETALMTFRASWRVASSADLAKDRNVSLSSFRLMTCPKSNFSLQQWNSVTCLPEMFVKSQRLVDTILVYCNK